ncbi:MAG: hypothetical protein MZU84_01730 [Sphingobacterium sp.]|nr:hypothetical protein [Sphingobacterium sp.]
MVRLLPGRVRLVPGRADDHGRPGLRLLHHVHGRLGRDHPGRGRTAGVHPGRRPATAKQFSVGLLTARRAASACSSRPACRSSSTGSSPRSSIKDMFVGGVAAGGLPGRLGHGRRYRLLVQATRCRGTRSGPGGGARPSGTRSGSSCCRSSSSASISAGIASLRGERGGRPWSTSWIVETFVHRRTSRSDDLPRDLPQRRADHRRRADHPGPGQRPVLLHRRRPDPACS